jgi:hypothetical protein
MLTFEQIASLIVLCETLQGDDKHALLTLLGRETHNKLEGIKNSIRRTYNHRHLWGVNKATMKKGIAGARILEKHLVTIYQLDK